MKVERVANIVQGHIRFVGPPDLVFPLDGPYEPANVALILLDSDQVASPRTDAAWTIEIEEEGKPKREIEIPVLISSSDPLDVPILIADRRLVFFRDSLFMPERPPATLHERDKVIANVRSLAMVAESPPKSPGQHVHSHIRKVLKNDKIFSVDFATLNACVKECSKYVEGAYASREHLLHAGSLWNEHIARTKEYIAKCRAIDLLECPEDFRLAYSEHIRAWERRKNLQERNVSAFMRSANRAVDAHGVHEAMIGVVKGLTEYSSDSSIDESFHQVLQAALRHGVQWRKGEIESGAEDAPAQKHRINYDDLPSTYRGSISTKKNSAAQPREEIEGSAEYEKACEKARAEFAPEELDASIAREKRGWFITWTLIYLGLTLPWFAMLATDKAWVVVGLVTAIFVACFIFLPEVLRIVRGVTNRPPPHDDAGQQ